MAEKHASLSLAALSALLQTEALDPVGLAEETLDGIAKHSDQAIFTAVTAERAMAEAKAAADRIRSGRSLGLLDGIPIAWKDLFDIEGMPTKAGSVVLSDAPAVRDAPVVAAMRQAGMVCVGRVNMSEFAFSGLGINPHYGTPRNPKSRDGDRLPGGSSSGSAVAVANGLVPVSIGTDTGGSVRIPAAFNGIVGYKATRGRYPMQGVYPLAKSLDSLGPLCRSVGDAIIVDAAMRGELPPARTQSPVASDISIVVPETVVFDDTETEVVSAFEQAIERLIKAGVKVRRQAFPAFDQLFQVMSRHGALVTAEAFALHHERLAGPEAERIDRRVVARLRLGERTTLVDYLTTLEARDRLIAEAEAMVGRSEVIAFPTISHVAPLTAPLIDDDDLFIRTNMKTLRNTLIGNFLDWCGVSIPCGEGAAGMPVGFLLSGLRNADEQLLAVARALEDTIRG